MKHRLLFVGYLFLLSLPCQLFPQVPNNVDSLKSQVPLLQDSLKIRNLLTIAKYHLMYIEADSARKYLNLVQQAEDLGTYPKLHAGSMDMMGTLESYEHNYTESLFWLEQAMALWKGQGNLEGESASCTNLGRTYAGINAFDKALEMHFRSLEIERELGYQRGIFLSLHNISTVFSITEEPRKAIQYQLSALAVQDFTPDTIDQIPVFMGLSGNYREIEKLDSALYYGKIALKLARKIAHLGFEIRILGSLAHTSNLNKDFHHTLGYLTELAPILDTTDYYLRGFYHNYLAEALFGQEKFAEAFQHAKIALNYADSLQEWMLLNNAYFQLYNFYKQQGPQKEALTYYDLYLEAEDSIYKQNQLKEIERLDIAFQTQEKEREIAELKEASLLQAEKLKQNSWLIGLSLLGLTIFSSSGVLVYKNRILQEEVKKSLTEQRLFRAQMNPHFFFHALGTIQQYILQENDSQESLGYLSKFAKLMRSTLESSNTEFIGLEKEIENLEHYIQLQQLRYDFSFDYHIAIDQNLEIKSYKIPPMLIQPIVENAIEHGLVHKGNEGKLTVNFHKYKAQLEISVEDNGVGRDILRANPPKKLQHNSVATQVIQERLKWLGKHLEAEAQMNIIDLTNREGKALGTRVVFHLPLTLHT